MLLTRGPRSCVPFGGTWQDCNDDCGKKAQEVTMATSNFWIEAHVDDRKPLRGGPRRKDGGLTVRLYLRRPGGGSDQPLSIEGYVDGDELALVAINHHTKQRWTWKSRR